MSRLMPLFAPRGIALDAVIHHMRTRDDHTDR
jgi:hypothetical protein